MVAHTYSSKLPSVAVNRSHVMIASLLTCRTLANPTASSKVLSRAGYTTSSAVPESYRVLTASGMTKHLGVLPRKRMHASMMLSMPRDGEYTSVMAMSMTPVSLTSPIRCG